MHVLRLSFHSTSSLPSKYPPRNTLLTTAAAADPFLKDTIAAAWGRMRSSQGLHQA